MRGARTSGLLLGAAAVGFVADALWRRTRARSLATAPSAAPDTPEGAYRLVRAAGVRVPEPDLRAARAHAADQGLDVLDLVPARLDTARALELLLLAPRRANRMARGATAGHALLVSADVHRRAEVTGDALTYNEMDELAIRLRRYAPVTTDAVIVPGLAPVPCTPAERRAVLRRRWLSHLPTYLTGNLLALGGLGALAARRPRWGAAVLAAACAQPYLATLCTPLRPHDRARFSLTRPVAAPYRWARVAIAPEHPDPRIERARDGYAADIAEGVERFLLPAATACPWCAGTDLRKLLTSGEYQRNKPGTFRLDTCRSCGHVFQNPRLSTEGLDFYYRDYYDGLGAEEVEDAFRVSGHSYKGRATMVRGHAVPKAWLDVGGGLGHFCSYARDIWPDTRFDALDMGAGIVQAEKQGWVDRAHRGFFIDKAAELAGRYDVVSMHHYLEHTLDPAAELDAAAKVLPAGGHLLVEVPDPQSPFGRLAGRWWHNWLQPQHLHLIPFGNLVQALHERGLEVVAVDRGTAHQRADALPALMVMLNRLVPDPDRPWRPAGRRRLRVAVRTAAYLAALPPLAAAFAADQLASAVIARTGGANAYRVLARKTG
ncbi:class I SAM-dependent methyltransferase [Actinomadura rugatobispora]|uniref:Class I SAM-dependent methyltransferase n=1 Tax=Actinomadura rugatobispora TaxID=1994 RepID=A0ABW1A4S1_9ACTN